ncbi:MAG: sulfurtransferase complex subunit TusB [Ferrovum sp.]|nr:sulfurtransferase complex subunit TusB [Ferrovum sp.]NDU88029.1 sulfurtransferase complex subunit TusB [Ferrovum sp.]
MLHIINKSPFVSSTLETCLEVATGGSVLLIEDAVYGAVAGTILEKKVSAAQTKLKLHVLGPDLEARGMSGALIPGVEKIDYAGFVDLVSRHKTCQSWL